MGRARALTYGVLSGAGAYVAMDVFVMSHLGKIDTGLRTLRHDMNPDAPSAEPQHGRQGHGLFASYRDKAAHAFRTNWNNALHSGYDTFVAAVRNTDVVQPPADMPVVLPAEAGEEVLEAEAAKAST